MTLRRLVRALAASTVIALAGMSAPATAADPAVSASPDRARARVNQRVFDRVWGEVRSEYYDPGLHGVDWNAARRTYRPGALAAVDDRALYAVVTEMLDLLDDDHAAAIPPAMARRQDRLRARRPVIGVTMRRLPDMPGVYAVDRIRPGSPAEKAGVRVGWRLDTTDPDNWSPARDVIEGEVVESTFVDEAGVAHRLAMLPAVMEPIPPFVADRSRGEAVIFRIEGFEPGLGVWLGRELAQTPAEVDVVLDLRDNPGGRLSEAIAVLSCFLPRDQAWATQTSRQGRALTLTTSGGCGNLSAPVTNDLAVLVDDGSRSAAELTPAALREAGRAVVVGQPTPGAVLISREIRLPDGGSLTLSRANFVTAGGVRLEKRGVTPDVSVDEAASSADEQSDRQVAVALALLARPREEQVRAVPAVAN